MLWDKERVFSQEARAASAQRAPCRGELSAQGGAGVTPLSRVRCVICAASPAVVQNFHPNVQVHRRIDLWSAVVLSILKTGGPDLW